MRIRCLIVFHAHWYCVMQCYNHGVATIASCYETLQTPSSHRLVRLSSNQDNEHIRCELITTSLSTSSDSPPVPYHALSYCWGSNCRDRTILVTNINDDIESRIEVTENLHAFLSARLCSNYEDWIFVDAICINQDDLEERAQQVRIMGKIYETASLVTIWLGQQNEDIERLLVRLNSFGEIYHPWDQGLGFLSYIRVFQNHKF